MIYDVNSLLSLLSICDGMETVFVRTPFGESYVVNGYEVDGDGDVILLTEKMEG